MPIAILYKSRDYKTLLVESTIDLTNMPYIKGVAPRQFVEDSRKGKVSAIYFSSPQDDLISDSIKALNWFDVNHFRLINVLKPKDGEHSSIFYFQSENDDELTSPPPQYGGRFLSQ